MLAQLSPPDENAEGVFMRFNITSMRVTPRQDGTAVNVWARIDCDSIGGMAIAGILLLCIPAAAICFPCFWVCSQFSSKRR
jgi:hypothetical protein